MGDIKNKLVNDYKNTFEIYIYFEQDKICIKYQLVIIQWWTVE